MKQTIKSRQRRFATDAARYLFTNVAGQRANTLQLISSAGVNLGCWCEKSAATYLFHALKRNDKIKRKVKKKP